MILRDLCNNFHAVPCWQNVPHYQLQQEGNLASSKTKVCIRVNQLFTLFELTQERATAWSFFFFFSASLTPSLWQRTGWITMSLSLPSLQMFSFSRSFRHPILVFYHLAATTSTPLPLCTPLKLFICSFKVLACSKLMLTHKLHYIFSPPFPPVN